MQPFSAVWQGFRIHKKDEDVEKFHESDRVEMFVSINQYVE